MVGNLLKTDSWIDDEKRTHCSVCVQQFLPFRRRHHCRTCGEVVCAGCSGQHTIRLTDVNVECATRICTFCVIRATDASIKANENALQETLLNPRRLSAVSVLSLEAPPNFVWRDKQPTLLSAESDLTSGSVVQLWPQPVPIDESARLEMARHSAIRSTEADPTMNLLVSIVARTLECPVAFVGIMDSSMIWIKASVGLDDNITHIPRDGSVCAHTLLQDTTMIVNDTCTDKYFHAGDQVVGSDPMRFYAGTPIRVRGYCIGVVCALDSQRHCETSDAMRSTLEAVANILSEVIEQRMNSCCITPADDQATSPDKSRHSDLGYQRRRGNGTNLDLNASLSGLNLLSPLSKEATKFTDTDSLLSTHLPREYVDKITVNMDYFHQLQSGEWIRHSTGALDDNDSITTFVSYNHEFTRSSTEFYGSCHDTVARLLKYNDALLYQHIFTGMSRHCKLGPRTWVDDITLQPDFTTREPEDVRVLTHWRQYPDGSNVVVAIDATAGSKASEADLLFGWFVAPCRLDDHRNYTDVSCFVSQPSENQQDVSRDLVRRLTQAMAQTSDSPRSIVPSTLQTTPQSTAHDGDEPCHRKYSINASDDQGGLKSSDRFSTTVNVSGSSRGCSTEAVKPSTKVALSVKDAGSLAEQQHSDQTPKLNENEQMLLELLDRTISTQEILAQQQHEMAEVIELHGTQLERLSTALGRVESFLMENEKKNKP